MIVSGYPGFLPGLVATALVALTAGPRLAAALGVGRALATAVLLSAGAILAATLFPDVLGIGSVPAAARTGWACDIGRLTPSVRELLELRESAANVALFAPLGSTIVLLPHRWRRWAIALALPLPFLIELVQMVLPALHRACQSADIADNLTGLILGMGIGLLMLVGRRVAAPDGWRDR